MSNLLDDTMDDNPIDEDFNGNEEEELEYDVEPEECQQCKKDAEDAGLEYTLEFYVKDRSCYCSNCRRGL